MAGPDSPLLQLRQWSLLRQTSEGEIPILEDIDLDLRPGRWLVVVGANGSGKSSLLKYLASDESPLSLERAIMFQDPDEQIMAASVLSELSLGRPEILGPSSLEPWGLDHLAGLDPRLLSAGQKQRLVLAVALAGNPKVLFCDEPTALQDPGQARWVLDRLQSWRDEMQGTLVTATCDRREALCADDILILDKGRVAGFGPVSEWIDHPLVDELLGEGLGGDLPFPVDETLRHPPWALELKNLDFDFLPGDVSAFPLSLTVGRGQRLGLVGPNGCGKSSVLAACVGARQPSAGRIVLQGEDIYQHGNRNLDHGLALLAPQFPEYLFTRSTVADEIALDPVMKATPPAEFLTKLGLDGALATRNPHSLSCGQKRRLALGLVIFSGRQILLLDEPTAALDRRGRHLVMALLAEVPPATTVVVASHDVSFLNQIGCQTLNLGEKPE